MGYLPAFYPSQNMVPDDNLVFIEDFNVLVPNIFKLFDTEIATVADIVVNTLTESEMGLTGDFRVVNGEFTEGKVMLIDSAPQKFLANYAVLLYLSGTELPIELLHQKTMSPRLITYYTSLADISEEIIEMYSDVTLGDVLSENYSLDFGVEVVLNGKNDMLIGVQLIFPNGREVEITFPVGLWGDYIEEISKNRGY